MSTYFNDIIAALDAHLVALADGTPIAWPNLDYDPSLGTVYYRPRYLPVDTSQVSMGSAGKDKTLGIYQIDIMHPKGGGRSGKIDPLADHFKRGSVIAYNGVSVVVRTVALGTPINDGAWYAIPVSVTIYAYTGART